MLRYIVRRVLESVPTLLLIVTLAFVLLHLAPAARSRLTNPAARDPPQHRGALPPAGALWRQYLRYLDDLAHGDLGPSFQYRNTSVNQIIATGFRSISP